MWLDAALQVILMLRKDKLKKQKIVPFVQTLTNIRKTNSEFVGGLPGLGETGAFGTLLCSLFRLLSMTYIHRHFKPLS